MKCAAVLAVALSLSLGASSSSLPERNLNDVRTPKWCAAHPDHPDCKNDANNYPNNNYPNNNYPNNNYPNNNYPNNNYPNNNYPNNNNNKEFCKLPEHYNHPDCKNIYPNNNKNNNTYVPLCEQPEHKDHPDCKGYNPKYPNQYPLKNDYYPYEKVNFKKIVAKVIIKEQPDFWFQPFAYNAFDLVNNQIFVSGKCYLGDASTGNYISDVCKLPVTSIYGDDAKPNGRELQATAVLCQILHLELGPIFLNLLGLVVTTNQIIIDIVGTANGILGRLLCDLLGSAPGGILAPSTAVIGLLNGLLVPTAATPALPATGVLAAAPAV